MYDYSTMKKLLVFLNKTRYRAGLGILIFIVLFVQNILYSRAETPDYAQEALERKELPIQSNDTSGWPDGPAIGAEAAIVMEVSTGTILYAKNINEELFPASTTKIMTCLLAVENASLSDTITFSHDAVFSVPNDGSSIGMDVGEKITMEQALYGIMVGSANEVANAVAEHVSGSIDAFVDLMNQRAKELGCTNTHFSNTNGLQEDNHYTSAHDLALIASKFFDNELLCRIGNTPRYHFSPTDTQPDDFYLNNKHKLITGEVKYEGILGGKTGYTSSARETLVTCAERNGMRLVCVVLKEESPAQFTDTVTLFDYGFNNFQLIDVTDADTRYTPSDTLFFESEHDVFGKSGTILSVDDDSSIILPKTAKIEDSSYDISYDVNADDLEKAPTALATVSYTYNGVPIGRALICYSGQKPLSEADTSDMNRTIYINVKIIMIIAASIVLLFTIIGAISSRANSNRRYTSRSDRIRYRRRKRESKKLKFNSKFK